MGLGISARILHGRRGSSGSPRGLMQALASFGVRRGPLRSGLCDCILGGRRNTSRRSKESDLLPGGVWPTQGSLALRRAVLLTWSLTLCGRVALCMALECAWQAWRLRHWVGTGDTFVLVMSWVAAGHQLCVAWRGTW